MIEHVQTNTDEWLSAAANMDQFADIASQSNLTGTQFLLWLGQKLEPDTPIYSMIQTFEIHGALNTNIFIQAFKRLIQDSDALRSVIKEESGVPQRRVLEQIPDLLELLDFSGNSNPDTHYQNWLADRKVRSFDLESRLFDSLLIKLAADRYIWYFNQHHLITDGWSFNLVYQRMEAIYSALLQDKTVQPTQIPAYADYVDYEKQYRESESFAKAETYWDNRLADPAEPLNFYHNERRQKSSRTERLVCELGKDRSERLRELTTQKGFQSFSTEFSLFNLFSTVFSALLHRLSQVEQLSLGVPFHNRPTSESKETIGVFIEICPVRIEIDPQDSFAALYQKITREMFTALRYVQPGISSSERNRDYEVLLNYVNVTFPPFCELPVHADWIHPGYGDSQHSLRLQIHDFNATGSYKLLFDFNVGIFNEQQRQTLIEQYLRVFDAFLANPDRIINQVGLASPDEQQKFVIDYNQTAAPFPADQTVVQLFENQVERTPHAPAVLFESKELTYTELNQRANQLAHKLRRLGAGPEQLVGVCMDHSSEMVVALLGILKSGAAYVPLDPTYPKERLAFMIADLRQATGMTRPVLVTQPWLTDRLPEGEHHLICLDDSWSAIDNEGIFNPTNPSRPNNLAYVIYTSGSTGLPKGVLIEHRSLVNYLWWARESYFQGELLDFALFSSLSFDLTVTSIYVPLISGSRILVYRDEPGSRGMLIRKVIEDNRAEIVKLTPAHLSMILDLDLSQSNVRKFIVGGFDFKTNLAHRIDLAYNSHIEIYNEYGPTETVVGCMIHRFDPGRDQAASVPIGLPAANVQIYILDKYLNPVPSQVTGEMYIGGVGVGRGYLNQAALTEQKFLSNPFRPGERMYRTGDLARWQSNGQMVFLGRADDQVKIGGARIELGEIEARLANHPRIKESVVSVIQSKVQAMESELRYCQRCGLPSNYPGILFDSEGICSQCHSYERIKDRAQTYFKSMDDLHKLFEDGRSRKKGQYDCLALVSGGKDSSYMLSQLAGMGLKVLSYTLDNGYISEQAKENIKKVSAYLGVDHMFGETPAMNAIFVESLQQYSNVCNGCFKTLYTLAVNVARQKGIPFIVTGLSRGQFFETRLTEDLFQDGALDNESIDQAILEARKVYHRRQDLISRELDVDAFRDDALFDDILFVDYYRYTDVGLDEVYAYLNEHVPWIRPADTGRSTNCLINDLGIYLHNKQRGFHNYALPYSWDVRMGHKNREDAIDELHDEIDEIAVKQMMQEIGYQEPDSIDDPSTKRLAAYYVSDSFLNASELRSYLGQYLPDFMLPSYLIQLDALPLTSNGKIDFNALPDPQSKRPDLESTYLAPRNSLEERLVRVWEETLGLKGIGVRDNFFELGGDSITSLQIVARTNKLGLQLKPNQLFLHPTIAELTKIASSTRIIAPQSKISGPVPLTPIQSWFLEHRFAGANHWNQTLQIDVMQPVDGAAMESSLNKLIEHHDQLRATFLETEDGWQQIIPSSAPALRLQHFDLANLEPAEQDAAITQIAASTQTHLDLTHGPMVHAALVALGSGQPARLILAVHHLVVDALSWWVLLDDLQTAYNQLRDKKIVTLPLKTTSYLHWAKTLQSKSDSLREFEYWQEVLQVPAANLPMVSEVAEEGFLEKNARTVKSCLDTEQTAGLLRRIPATYDTQIDDALLAALASTLTDWLKVQNLRIDLERHGREEIDDEIDLTRTVGWFTTIHPMILSNAGTDPGNHLREVKATLEAVPNKGIGFGMLRYLHEKPTMRKSLSGSTGTILFNHLGQYNTLLSGSPDFRIAQDLRISRSQSAKRPYHLEINSIIRDGQLQVDWTYPEKAFDASTIETLAQSYIHHLGKLVESVFQVEKRGSIPAGVIESGLDDDELDALFAEFGETSEESFS